MSNENETPVNDLRPEGYEKLEGYGPVELTISKDELRAALHTYHNQFAAMASIKGAPETCKAGILSLQGIAFSMRRFMPGEQVLAILNKVKSELESFEPYAKLADEAQAAAIAERAQSDALFEQAAAATKH